MTIRSAEVSGYDLISRAKELNQALDAQKPQEPPASDSEPSEPVSASPTTPAPNSTLALSVQALPAVPIEIIVSFAASLIALFSCLGSFGRAPARAASTVGGVASVVAILQLTLANSDLHTWFREQIDVDSTSLAQNPFNGLAKQLESLAANSFQLKPGAGLYVLAAALSLAAILLHVRALSSAPSVEPLRQSLPPQSDTSPKLFVFLALLVFCIAIAVVVLTHAPLTTSNPHNMRQTTQSAFGWPVTGLPEEIAGALNTPDLAPEPGTQTELTLGISGEKQIIETDAENSENCGSGGCSWRLIDATTKENLISDQLGSLHKTTSVTDGYFDLVVEGKLTLLLYQHRGSTYQLTSCYDRSNGIGSVARAVSCDF